MQRREKSIVIYEQQERRSSTSKWTEHSLFGQELCTAKPTTYQRSVKVMPKPCIREYGRKRHQAQRSR